MVTLTVNGQPVTATVDSDTPLLWLLRDQLDLTGTKFGCGIGVCGACTVLINGREARACTVTAATLAGAEVVTIEGLTAAGDPVAARLAEAWIAEQASQCGYCAPGLMMAAVALLRRSPQPSDGEIDAALTNLCRCGSYPRVRKAIHRAAAAAVTPPPTNPTTTTKPPTKPTTPTTGQP
jgi:isoquinoline 1-oxidoreductase alpha subunit